MTKHHGDFYVYVSNCIAAQRVNRRAPPHDNLENVIEISMCTYLMSTIASPASGVKPTNTAHDKTS